MSGRFVIDASATLAWLFDEDQAAAKLEPTLAGADLVAPMLWRLEVVNAILVKERRKILTAAQGTQLLELLQDWSVEVINQPAGQSLSQFASMARPHQLTAYDAAYLDVAMRLNLPLLTRDANLIAAARRVGVTVIQ